MKKKLISIILLIAIFIPIFAPIEKAVNDNVLLISKGVTITKDMTVEQVTNAYGQAPKLVTKSAFGGNAYTYYKGEYEDILYIETDETGTIISYGALSDDFQSELYSTGVVVSNDNKQLNGTVIKDIFVKKPYGFIAYRKDLMTNQRITLYCNEFVSNRHFYEKNNAKHSVIMLNHFLKKDGCSVMAEFNEDLYDTVDKIIKSGKSISEYAEKNGKEYYYKSAGTDFGTGTIWTDYPNPLRPVEYAYRYYPTESKKYAYLVYRMWEKEDGDFSGGTDGYYFSQEFIEKNEASANLTQEEQTKYENAKKCYQESVNMYNQNGDSYFEVASTYKTTPLVAGSIKENKLKGATDFLNAIRLGAGLPKVTYNSNVTSSAQHKATLISYMLYNGKSLTNSHYPTKPDEVSQDFYNEAQRIMSSENIYNGNLITSIRNAIDDTAGDSITCGHRYNLLNPNIQNLGIGYTEYGQAVHKFSGSQSNNINVVAWPSVGITPMEAYNGGYWTCKFYNSSYTTTTSTQVTVKCLNNNKEWNFTNESTTGDHRYSKYSGMVSFYDQSMTLDVTPNQVYEITIKNVKDKSNQIVDYTYRSAFMNLAENSTMKYPESIQLDQTQVKAIQGTKFELNSSFSEGVTEVRTKWSSSNPSIATVNQFGEVTVVGNGSATITAETLNGKKATCTVQCVSEINGLSIEEEYVLKVGDMKKINVSETSGIKINNNDIAWTVSDNTKAKVTNGIIEMLAEGEITVTASYMGKTKDCKIKVIPRVSYWPAFKFRMPNYSSFSDMVGPGETVEVQLIQEGSQVYLTKINLDFVCDNTNLEIEKIETNLNGLNYKKTSNKTANFSYVLESGIKEITGVLATITLRAKDDCVYAKNDLKLENIVVRYYGKTQDQERTFQYPSNIQTANAIQSITLSKTELLFTLIGESTKLEATINPTENVKSSKITWSSDNTNVAVVDSSGKIQAKGNGSATIIATVPGGKKATCKVTVEAVAAPLGDINNDGRINPTDARLALLYYVGKEELTPSQLQSADVNKDGKVNPTDARQILLYYVGKITNF